MGNGDPAQARWEWGGERSAARRRGASRGALTWAHLAPAHLREGKMAGGERGTARREHLVEDTHRETEL